MSNQDKLDPQIQKILDHTPKITNVLHAFFSAKADIKTKGRNTVRIADEFGNRGRANFVGGCQMADNGAIIPDDKGVRLDADAHTYSYVGYINEVGMLVYSDHTPERPRFFGKGEPILCLPAPEQPQTDPQQDHNPQP